jgi:hypothetical protein
MSRNRGGKTHRDKRSNDEYEDEEERGSVNEWHNRGGKTRRDERSDDEFEDEEERGSVGRGTTVNELLNE